jgi:hypothetical protein
MAKWRVAAAGAALAASAVAASPASAQFYFQSREMKGERVRGDEPGIIGQPLPGATPAELRAGVTWTMRAALNVAALQCQFEPTLLTVGHYNAILRDHKAELASSFTTLDKYFLRVGKTKAAGQKLLDQFGTRTYSSFATVAAQLNFCETAHLIGRDAIFAKRGTFGDLSLERIRELRNSLTPYGEQRFARYLKRETAMQPIPRLDPICWDKKNRWNAKKCGALNWPPAGGVGVAAR